MPKTLNRRMTRAEFHACLPFVQQLAEDRVIAAREVLVDGDQPVVVAARHGWSRQAVHICVEKVWDALQNFQAAKRYEAEMTEAALPPGWRVATVAAPAKVMARLQADAKAAAAAAGIPSECTTL
jgi:hypothetical protein